MLFITWISLYSIYCRWLLNILYHGRSCLTSHKQNEMTTLISNSRRNECCHLILFISCEMVHSYLQMHPRFLHFFCHWQLEQRIYMTRFLVICPKLMFMLPGSGSQTDWFAFFCNISVSSLILIDLCWLSLLWLAHINSRKY